MRQNFDGQRSRGKLILSRHGNAHPGKGPVPILPSCRDIADKIDTEGHEKIVLIELAQCGTFSRVRRVFCEIDERWIDECEIVAVFRANGFHYFVNDGGGGIMTYWLPEMRFDLPVAATDDPTAGELPRIDNTSAGLFRCLGLQ